MNTKNICKSTLLAVFATIALTGIASAQTAVYLDTFSGSAATTLNGKTPDTTTGGVTWTTAATTSWFANGAFNSSNTNAYLAFTPVIGRVYTLSGLLNVTSGDAVQIFYGNSNTTVFATNNSAIIRLDGGGTTLYTSNAQNGNFGSGTTVTNNRIATIVLDATSPTLWTATYSYNGTSFGSTSVTPGSISAVGFSAGLFGAATGLVDNLSLTYAVPEPSTYAMMLGGLGGLALVLRRRMRHS